LDSLDPDLYFQVNQKKECPRLVISEMEAHDSPRRPKREVVTPQSHRLQKPPAFRFMGTNGAVTPNMKSAFGNRQIFQPSSGAVGTPGLPERRKKVRVHEVTMKVESEKTQTGVTVVRWL
jgi:hypothetical protein